MVAASAALPASPLDVPTLSFVAICISAVLGLTLIFAWIRSATFARSPGGERLISSAPRRWRCGRAGAAVHIAAGGAGGADLRRLRHDLERRAAVPRAPDDADHEFLRRHRLAVAVPVPGAGAGQQRAHRLRRRGGRRLYFPDRLRAQSRTPQVALFAHRRDRGAVAARHHVSLAAGDEGLAALERRLAGDVRAGDHDLRGRHRHHRDDDGQGLPCAHLPQRRLDRRADRPAQPPRLHGERAADCARIRPSATSR